MPLLAAEASIEIAFFTWAAAWPSPAAIAARACLTTVRTLLRTERLRVVRVMRWRLRLAAEGWFDMLIPRKATWIRWWTSSRQVLPDCSPRDAPETSGSPLAFSPALLAFQLGVGEWIGVLGFVGLQKPSLDHLVPSARPHWGPGI